VSTKTRFDIPNLDHSEVKMTDEFVIVNFPVSCFGWMPVVTTVPIWEEIYDAYQDTVMTEIDDDEQSIQIDLCDSVKSAIVTPNPSDDLLIWAGDFPTESFFTSVCLGLDDRGSTLHYELLRRILPLFMERGGSTDEIKGVSLGVIQMVGHLNGEEFEIRAHFTSDDAREFKLTRRADSSVHVFADDYVERITEILDGIEPRKIDPDEQGVIKTLSDKTADVDLSAFD